MEALLFPLLLIVAGVEMFLSGTWSTFYFTVGLPIFRRRVPMTTLAAGAEQRLEEAHAGGMAAPLVFRRLSNTQIAFREKAFGFRLLSYTPIMHGLIRHESEQGDVYVVGFANWFSVIFAGAWVMVTRKFEPMMLVVLFLVFGLLYAIQAYRYSSVARFLDSSAERSNSALHRTPTAPRSS